LDGTTSVGRTMEFGFDIKSDILVVPAGTKFTTLALNTEKSGLMKRDFILARSIFRSRQICRAYTCQPAKCYFQQRGG
jgi:penicillin V acylase-like amidase (Ntn superfamily)